ncbi:MAG: BsuPI-related putative proteinase inhibitor [Verrucomicrobiota bacterium]
MSRFFALAVLYFALAAPLCAQQPAPQTQSEKRSWLSRMLHPFRSAPVPVYKDPRLRGLTLELKLSPQPVKLSEIRQLEVKLTLTNVSKRAVELEFPTEQRIEILLRNSADAVLTTWSDNHAFEEKAGTVLVNPEEHIYYAETIATRELAPNRVYVAEIFFPQYPELRLRQKFLTAP